MINELTMGVCIVIATISTILILSERYEDGVVGRIALALICTASLFTFATLMDSTTVPLNLVLMFLIGVAMFFLRHLFRFLKFARKEETRHDPT
jgi:hypothetical protein